MGERLPRWLSSQEADCSPGDVRGGSIPGSGRSLEKETATTPVFLPGQSRGQRDMMGYSPWFQKEPDTTEVTEQACPVMGERKDAHQQKLREASNQSPFFFRKTSVSFTF